MKSNNITTDRTLNALRRHLSRTFLLLSLLTLGVGQTKANDASSARIYFDNTNTSWTYVQLLGGHSTWSSGTALSKISGTNNLWSCSWSWGGYTYFMFINASGTWGGEGNEAWARRTYATNYSSTTSDNVGSDTYLYVPNGGGNDKGFAYSGKQSGGYSDLNYTQTLQQQLSTDGGSTYSSSTLALATVNVKANYLTGATTTSEHNSSISSGSSSTTCTAVRTATVTYTVSSVATGYSFVGWYDGSTQKSTSTTYTYNCSETKTITARFKANQYTGTINANGGAANQSYTATYKNTSLTIATAPSRTGYTLSGYYKEAACSNLIANTSKALQASTTYTNSSKQWTYTSAPTLYAGWTANQYTITLNKNGGTGGTGSVKATYNSSSLSASITNPTKTGYTFGGWYSGSGGTGTLVISTSGALQANVTISSVAWTNASSQWVKDTGVTLYAKWTANTYTISFSNSGTGYGSGGQTATKTATYNAAMPSVSYPTASAGYKFMGYFDAENGAGTQYYTATGTSAHVWDKTSGATLYAYYAPATITAVTLNKEVFEQRTTASGTHNNDYVTITAEPTIAPTGYTTSINITWELEYSNGNPVTGHDVTYLGTNRAEFSIVGLAKGTYQLHATIRTGSTRGSGTVVSTYDKAFQIASDYDITVLYKCGDVTIKPSTVLEGISPINWSSNITPPTIFGYTFQKWVAGDGVTITTNNGSTTVTETTTQTIKIKASFDGSLTALYTKKNIVYFKNTLGWSNVYVYFYGSDGYWDSNGAGSKGDGHGPNTMTQIAGTNVWYYEYTGTKERHIAFTKDRQENYQNFYNTEAAYPTRGGTQTDSEFSNRGFNAATPMFVPNTTTTETKNGTDYFSNGYWTTYVEGTGYTLKIYNQRENGRIELKSVPFVASGADNAMPYSVDVDLEAGKTYGFKFERSDGIYYYNSGTYTVSNNGQEWAFPFDNSDHYATGLQTNAAGTYKFSLSCNSSNGDLYVSIKYPVKKGDFRLNYTDNATWSKGAHTLETSLFPSKVITARANGVDTVSFFVSKGTGITAKIRWEKASAVAAGSVTWGTVGSWNTTYTSVSEPGVYNFRVVQNAAGTAISTITNIGKYTGNYYIRCDAVAGKWDNYRTDHDHLMTYSEFSESAANSFGPKYSHYKAKWCPRNTNIKFCIANDYGPCITDTLIEDVGTTFSNMTSGGTLLYEKNGDESMKYPDDGNAYLDKYSANVRFMWHRQTNKISRAYVSAATSNEARFLVLQGSGYTNANIYSSLGNALTANPPGVNSIKLQDDQNWIYETTIMANPSARIKLYANYCDVQQYFCGTSGSGFTTSTSVELLGGSAASTKYSVRVIYDFKTNRLVCAWIPTGHSQEIDGTVIVNADVMFVRDHQDEAQCITFSNPPTDKLTQVKTVYGSMRFNRWILGNRQHPEDTDPDHCSSPALITTYHPPLSTGAQLSQYERALYFISFPFDVKVSEIFGFGQYGVHWVIEYYDGLTRARNGYWMDSPPNWKFVDPDMALTYELKKGVGYILCLNLSKMAYDDTEFWSNNISQTELFFPSKSTISEITAVNETIPALSEEYKCTINRGTVEGDRRIKDSYWRCIGVPGYATYNGSLTTSGSDITWKTDDTGEFNISKFPFFYAWNTADNTLTAQSTTTMRLKATHAYLIQNGNQIEWSKTKFKNSIVARRQKAEDIINTDWRLTISRNEQVEDQAYVRMSDNEDVTEEFDFGQDLIKELNSTRSNIYSYIGYERCAANSMPINTTSTTTVPLGVKVSEAGDYTIALPDGASGINLTLIDTETGNRTNLSAGLDYTLTLEAGDYNDRFFLEIAPIQHIATGIEEPTSDSSLKGRAQKKLINGILYIVRDGKIFDARGSRVE